MTFVKRRPLMEDNFWWKMTFDGRQTLTEDDLWWKTTINGRQHLIEDNLWKKTPFDRICCWLLTLTVTAQLTPNRKCYQLSQLKIDGKKYTQHCACAHVYERRLFRPRQRQYSGVLGGWLWASEQRCLTIFLLAGLTFYNQAVLLSIPCKI